MKRYGALRIACWLFAFALVLQSVTCLVIIDVQANMSDDFAEKYVIFDGGAQGKQVTFSAGRHVEWSTNSFNLNVPESMPQDKIGLYIHVTLDAAAAEAMNTDGSIELAKLICDKSEIHCNTTVFQWREGENEAIIPMMAIGAYTDGGQDRFDVYESINWFRFYTTPGKANLTKNAKITIWEIAVIDSTQAGIAFGSDDTYMQLTSPLTATPNTIEASIKANALATSWTLGTYDGARYSSPVMTAKSGTITGVEGIPDGTPYVGGTVHKGGYFGTKDMKFSVSIPKAYGAGDLALAFWLYTSTGEVTKSYLELTSSGKCDVEEICWTTKDAEFADLEVGWNYIVLPLDSRSGAGFDYTNINFSRFWGSSSESDVAKADFEMYVSEMKVIVYDGEGLASDGFEMVEGLPTWKVLDFSKQPQNWDGGKITVGKTWKNDGTGDEQPADGTVYMEVRPEKTLTFEANHPFYPSKNYWKAGFTASASNSFIIPNIPKQYKLEDLSFAFWIYVPEADLVPGDISADCPNFEFTSDGDVDGAEIDYLNMWKRIGGLKDGWNYVEIPLSEMDAASSFDLYGINFLRWTYMCSLKDTTGKVDECVRYADFRIVSNVDRSNEKKPTTDDSTVASDDTYMIFSNVGSDSSPIALYLSADGFVAWTWGEKSFVSDFNAYTGEWIDLALVRDMTQEKFLLYADGKVVATESANGTKDILPSVPHSIAADGNGKGVFDGYITDVRAWSDVRTAQEIEECRVPKVGREDSGLIADEQGLLGAWFLMGDSNYILDTVTDSSYHDNTAVYRGSRAENWVDYQIPTDVIGENYFSLVFIPDIQELVTGTFTEEWMAAAQWIADNVDEENIVHVIGAGDTTWSDAPDQWEIARAGFDLFSDKVSWSNMTGNHDYPGSCTPVNNPEYILRDTRNYARYFGQDYIYETEGCSYFVDYFEDPYELSTTENAYYRFEINGIDWMILQLEYLPRVHVIEWANKILSEYPADNVILTTHSYISGDEAKYCTQWMPYTKGDAEHGGYIGSLTGNAWPNGTTQPIWDELIYNNDNVKLLLCGHDATTDGHVLTRLTKNAAGHTVPQVMINAQDLDVSYFKSHAMGMLGVMRFSSDGQKVEIQYYSPYHDATFQPSCEQMLSFTLNITGEATVKPDIPGSENTPPEDENHGNEQTPDDMEENPGQSQQPSTSEPKDEGGCASTISLNVASIVLLVTGHVLSFVLQKKKKE